MPTAIPIITIDGPVGSGKGTLARLVAEKLGWHLLDSGAVYRALALYAMQQDCDLSAIEKLEVLAQNLPLEFKNAEVYLAGQVVTLDIRQQTCGTAASQISAFPEVRQALLDRQRAFAQLPGLVADGRDMGTVVFPQAIIKIYLDASVEERAKRRFLQLKDAGQDVKLHDLAAEITQRDLRDKTRAVAPLRPADDAVIIDSSNMQISEVFETIISLTRQRLSKV